MTAPSDVVADAALAMIAKWRADGGLAGRMAAAELEDEIRDALAANVADLPVGFVPADFPRHDSTHHPKG